ncbi:tRNA A64-2'-O-ribosylphosphate transferase [Kalaharituber pfeilii]|nr:tRNA A64-2'-O-ribosylphosphate transferase [Kalaharituber pfeilii]
MPNNTSTSTAPFLPTLRPPSPSFSPSISLPPKPTFPTLPRGTSRSLLHRLRSIHTDSQFLTTVISALHPPLPVLVNKRAGEWYLDPKERQGAVYFKSTDGHYGNWGFSTRRLNLAVLEVTGGDVRGAIIVDSTRRGKRYPDSLSKTIPIWCAVINALLFPDFPSTYHQVFTPPRAVSKQETAHINSLMPTFVQQFMELNLDLKKQIKCLPKKPLRPYFVTPDDFFLHEQEEGESLIFEDYIPLVLVSVSRVVRNDGIEGEYIQGAG